jgi:hypothetical protein
MYDLPLEHNSAGDQLERQANRIPAVKVFIFKILTLTIFD